MMVTIVSKLVFFFKDPKAAIMPLFSVLLVPVLAASAAAVDYSIWLGTKTELQAVADAAALGGVTKFQDGSAADAIAEANGIIDAYGLGGVSRQIQILDDGRALRVSLATQGEPVMSGFMSKDGTTISASATAMARFDSEPCILALNEVSDWGVQVEGSAQLHAIGCTVWSNSRGDQSFRSYPATTTRAARICAVGNIHVRGDVSPAPERYCNAQEDPLADWVPPFISACLSSAEAAGRLEGGILYLKPGTYCGGLSLNTGEVVLEPGIFIIKDGPFSLHGNVRITGNGVGIYLTGVDAYLDFAGTGRLQIKSMSYGAMEAIAIASDRNSGPSKKSSVGLESTTTGNFTLSFEGTIYLPKQIFTFWGNSDSGSPPPLSHIIADRVQVGGSGILYLRSAPEEADVKSWLRPVSMVRLVK